MKTLSTFIVMMLLFGFTNADPFKASRDQHVQYVEKEVKQHPNLQFLFDQANFLLIVSWPATSDVWITTQFNFQTHYIRTMGGRDSFTGVVMQPNADYTYWFGGTRYIFHWVGYDYTCIVTQVI